MHVLVAAFYAAVSFALYLWRAWRRTPAVDRRGMVAVVLCFSTFPVLGGLLRGYSLAAVLAVAGSAWLGLTVGTWGRVERLYGKWLTPPIKVGAGEQIRIVLVFTIFCVVAIPLWLVYLGTLTR